LILLSMNAEAGSIGTTFLQLQLSHLFLTHSALVALSETATSASGNLLGAVGSSASVSGHFRMDKAYVVLSLSSADSTFCLNCTSNIRELTIILPPNGRSPT